MRVSDQVLSSEHGPSGYPMRLQQVRQRPVIVRGRPLAQVLVEFLPVLPAPEHSVEAWLHGPGRFSHGLFEVSPLMVSGHAEGDPAVRTLTGVHIVRRLPPMGGAETRSCDTTLGFEERWSNA